MIWQDHESFFNFEIGKELSTYYPDHSVEIEIADRGDCLSILGVT